MSSPYLPQTPQDQKEMLTAAGAASLEDLFSDIPAAIRRDAPLALPPALSELELLAHLQGLAGTDAHAESSLCFLGGGMADHFIPAIVPHLASRSEFVTAYTPYQAEMSQGLLQAFWEYQSLISDLTALPVSNASLYDGASALAEAVLMAHGANGRTEFLIARGVHPEYRQVAATYTQNLGFSFVEIPARDGKTDRDFIRRNLNEKTAAVILQNPNFFGCIEAPAADLAGEVKARGALFILAVDPNSLGILSPPGEVGASICVGEGQGLGNDMSFGGPTLGFMACEEQFLRRMPGRLIGQTRDTRGRRGFVLTLQTREQHIRREKATSNICSNEALLALRAAIYLAAMGKQGMKESAGLCLQKSHYALREIEAKTRFKAAFHAPFFKEFTLRSPFPASQVREHLLSRNILGGLDLGASYPEYKDHLLFCVTEKRTRAEIDALVRALGEMK